MYVPPHFAETDREVLKALIRAHPLGTWVVPSDGTLIVNHIPFLVRGDTLVGHVARANDVWKRLGAESVVVFQGAEAYISPSWYASKREHGKVVPTWNYAVVHGARHSARDRGQGLAVRARDRAHGLSRESRLPRHGR
jgi:transcriptional regulator